MSEYSAVKKGKLILKGEKSKKKKKKNKEKKVETLEPQQDDDRISHEMLELPSALFVSCTSYPPEDLILRAFGSLPESKDQFDGVKSYDWRIDNKYYVADVNLHTLTSRRSCTDELLGTVQALVVYFNNELPSAMDDIKNWTRALAGCEPEVKLLVCPDCEDREGGLTRSTVSQWCLKEGFELVELDGDDAEESGPSRVRQALEAHMWPNLKQKPRVEPTPTDDSHSRKLPTDTVEPPTQELEVDSDFCNLFGQLANIKEQASRLSSEDRKKFAEQVVLAYWKSIGGDEDEILDC